MTCNMELQSHSSGARKTIKKKASGFRARFKRASEDAHSTIDVFENFITSKPKEQVYAAGIAVIITLIIFMTALYYGNYLVALIVVAVWITT